MKRAKGAALMPQLHEMAVCFDLVKKRNPHVMPVFAIVVECTQRATNDPPPSAPPPASTHAKPPYLTLTPVSMLPVYSDAQHPAFCWLAVPAFSNKFQGEPWHAPRPDLDGMIWARVSLAAHEGPVHEAHATVEQV